MIFAVQLKNGRRQPIVWEYLFNVNVTQSRRKVWKSRGVGASSNVVGITCPPWLRTGSGEHYHPHPPFLLCLWVWQPWLINYTKTQQNRKVNFKKNKLALALETQETFEYLSLVKARVVTICGTLFLVSVIQLKIQDGPAAHSSGPSEGLKIRGRQY